MAMITHALARHFEQTIKMMPTVLDKPLSRPQVEFTVALYFHHYIWQFPLPSCPLSPHDTD